MPEFLPDSCGDQGNRDTARTSDLSPIHSWNLMGPIEVSAEKSGTACMRRQQRACCRTHSKSTRRAPPQQRGLPVSPRLSPGMLSWCLVPSPRLRCGRGTLLEKTKMTCLLLLSTTSNRRIRSVRKQTSLGCLVRSRARRAHQYVGEATPFKGTTTKCKLFYILVRMKLPRAKRTAAQATRRPVPAQEWREAGSPARPKR